MEGPLRRRSRSSPWTISVDITIPAAFRREGIVWADTSSASRYPSAAATAGARPARTTQHTIHAERVDAAQGKHDPRSRRSTPRALRVNRSPTRREPGNSSLTMLGRPEPAAGMEPASRRTRSTACRSTARSHAGHSAATPPHKTLDGQDRKPEYAVRRRRSRSGRPPDRGARAAMPPAMIAGVPRVWRRHQDRARFVLELIGGRRCAASIHDSAPRGGRATALPCPR